MNKDKEKSQEEKDVEMLNADLECWKKTIKFR